MRLPNYVWSDPTRPVTVRLSLRVLNRLALAGPDDLPGGLLLGGTELHDGRHIICIEGFEPVASDRLAEAISHYRNAVGMYRTQTREGSLKIQLHEAVLFSHYFTRPDALFLLVHQGTGRAVYFSSEGEEFAAMHEFAFRVTEPSAVPVPARWRIARPVRWAIEGVALVLGVVAGAALFQHFHPPPVWVPPAQYVAEHATPEPPTPVVSAHPEEADPRPSPFVKTARPVVPPRAPARVKVAAPLVVAAKPPAAEPEPAPAPAPISVPVVAVKAPAPEPAPVRNEARSSTPSISVEVEPVTGSRFGKAVSRIPLLRRLNRQADSFVPPSPTRQVNPRLSAREREEVTDSVRVNVRVYVDESGKVQYAELLSNAKRYPNLSTAAVYASRRWDFVPAVQDGQHVPGEVILHFHFAPPEPPTAVTDSQD